MKCGDCHKNVDELLATFWNGKQWHRSCAVKYQKEYIDKLNKKIASSGISQVKHAEVQKELEEAKEDLKALIKIQKDEHHDTQCLGKIMVRHGFGKRVDTHRLLESGEISRKMIERASEIKELYGE